MSGETPSWERLPVYSSAAEAVEKMKRFPVGQGKEGFVDQPTLTSQRDAALAISLVDRQGNPTNLLTILQIASQGRFRLAVAKRTPDAPTMFRASAYPSGDSIDLDPQQASKVPVNFPD